MIGCNIDLTGLDGLLDIENIVQQEVAAANLKLGATAHAHAVELATNELHSRRETYLKALTFFEADGVAVLQLDASALWIEEGIKGPWNMLDALLSSPKAKISKDGKRYLVIPFDHSPGHGATNTTPAQLDLVNTVRSEMKRRRIPWAKVERDDNGRPLLGRLHKFSVNDAPLKTHHGPGQGRGAIGDVRQGPGPRQLVGGAPGGGTPFLAGVGVYQKLGPGGSVQRSVMTFRVASEDHIGQERWDHPGLEPKRFLERTEKWALEQADNLIVPDLMERIVARL